MQGNYDYRWRREPKWDWVSVNCNLRTLNESPALWNLKPTIALTNPTDPVIKLFIDIEKSLQYSDQLGWNWHKSWNLPNISVKLEIKDSTTGESMLAPSNLYAHIFAVKIVIDPQEKSDNIHLEDVGLRGISKIDMVDSQAYFSTMKFESTSYNNDGVKFHLLLVLYILGEEGEQPRVLLATISPHIFVDSRKSARDNQQKKYSSFIEPFPVDSLDKQFIKRENKRKSDAELRIQNNAEGFLNYLTAPNIRHKVKHPVFLILRFSKSAILYFNKTHIPSGEFSEILDQLQRRLIKDHSKKAPNKLQRRELQRIFILLINAPNDPHKCKKIYEAIQPLESPSFHVSFSKEDISQEFSEVVYHDDLIDIYKRTYSHLNSICKSYAAEFYEKNEEDSEDSQSEESEESVEQPPRKRANNAEITPDDIKIQERSKSDQDASKVQLQNQYLKSLLVNRLGVSQEAISGMLNNMQGGFNPGELQGLAQSSAPKHIITSNIGRDPIQSSLNIPGQVNPSLGSSMEMMMGDKVNSTLLLQMQLYQNMFMQMMMNRYAGEEKDKAAPKQQEKDWFENMLMAMKFMPPPYYGMMPNSMGSPSDSTMHSSIPGAMTGGIPNSMLLNMPGLNRGTQNLFPGMSAATMPGSLPGAMSGAMPGSMPGSMHGAYPSSFMNSGSSQQKPMTTKVAPSTSGVGGAQGMAGFGSIPNAGRYPHGLTIPSQGQAQSAGEKRQKRTQGFRPSEKKSQEPKQQE